MSPGDRQEIDGLLERLRGTCMTGVDNIAEIVKERDVLAAYVAAKAEVGDAEARKLIVITNKPLPHRF